MHLKQLTHPPIPLICRGTLVKTGFGPWSEDVTGRATWGVSTSVVVATCSRAPSSSSFQSISPPCLQSTTYVTHGYNITRRMFWLLIWMVVSSQAPRIPRAPCGLLIGQLPCSPRVRRHGKCNNYHCLCVCKVYAMRQLWDIIYGRRARRTVGVAKQRCGVVGGGGRPAR